MVTPDKFDLRELLIDAHAHFFFLRGEDATRVRLWQILRSSIIIDTPKNVPLRKTILGYVPTLDNYSIYEIEGTVNCDPVPDQMPNTVRIEIAPFGIKKVSRRQFPRVNFTPPVSVQIRTSDKEFKLRGDIVNMSAGGLRVETFEALAPTTLYHFIFSVETDDEVHELNLAGTIVYEVPSESGHVYGIRFGKPKIDDTDISGEVPVGELDRTVDLLNLVNQLIIKER